MFAQFQINILRTHFDGDIVLICKYIRFRLDTRGGVSGDRGVEI